MIVFLGDFLHVQIEFVLFGFQSVNLGVVLLKFIFVVGFGFLGQRVHLVQFPSFLSNFLDDLKRFSFVLLDEKKVVFQRSLDGLGSGRQTNGDFRFALDDLLLVFVVGEKHLGCLLAEADNVVEFRHFSEFFFVMFLLNQGMNVLD